MGLRLKNEASRRPNKSNGLKTQNRLVRNSNQGEQETRIWTRISLPLSLLFFICLSFFLLDASSKGEENSIPRKTPLRF